MTTGVAQRVEGIRNKAIDVAARFTGPNVKVGALHAGVHSPIIESAAMIDEMKRMGISAVDCEASFIARALASTAVNLYHTVIVSDVPGTHESIGMGGSGHAASAAATNSSAAQKIEHIALFMDVLVEILGNNLRPAEGGIPPVAIDKITDSAFSLKLESTPVEFNFQLVYPQINKGDQTTERNRIVNLFARELFQLLQDSGVTLSQLKQTSDPQLRGKLHDLQTEIMNLSLKFQQVHKVKVWLTNMVLPEGVAP
jgi:hypothetical protein